jgi:hypothetical protein
MYCVRLVRQLFAVAALSCYALLLLSCENADLRRPVTSAVAGSCYLLVLGPTVAPEEREVVAVPSVFELRPNGHVVGLLASTDSNIQAESQTATWRRAGDSVLVDWSFGALSGSVYFRFLSIGDSLRGRYEIHHHQSDDGRFLWRGDARAVRAACGASANLREVARDAQGSAVLAHWRSTARSDTALAADEASEAFERFLRDTPVHTLSLFNYRIAEFVCRQGHLPATLAELRKSLPMEYGPLAAVDNRSWRDAWNQEVVYRRHEGEGYEVRSVGPDRTPDTPDDIVSRLARPLERDRETNCR